MIFEPIVLKREIVRLEPLCEKHKEGLCRAIYDGELWNLFYTLVPHPNEIDNFLDNAIESQKSGSGLGFAVIDQHTDTVAGSTRFMNANIPNKRVEIGFTFLGQAYQKTKINTETKLLMLSHAFDRLRLNRVELITDYLNSNSRNAILRLGAKQEGILRNHMVMPNGRVRDSVLFSIIENEWAGIKQNLEYKLL